MDQERIWLLITRKFSKEATPEELQELEEMFRKHPDIQYAYLLINELEESTQADYGLDDKEIKKMRENGLARWHDNNGDAYPWERKRGLVHGRGKIWVVCAACLVMVAGFIFFNRPGQSDQRTVKTSAVKTHPVVYKASETSSIELQDGTKVWLNRGSTLRCSNDFGLNEREVYLEGEAFFDVASNAKKPFIVHAGSWMDIKVLGTRFNVKVYPGDPYIETALVTGKIAVNIKQDNNREVILKPHQKVTFYAKDETTEDQQRRAEAGNQLKVSEIKKSPTTSTIAETAWMEDKLAFYDITFGELAYDLERTYHRKIEFKDERIKAYHLTGEFKNEDINQILKALQITTPFHYEITDDLIVITD